MWKRRKKSLTEEKLEQIVEKEKEIEVKIVKGFIRVNKAKYDRRTDRTTRVVSIMNESGNNIWRKEFNDNNNVFGELKSGSKIEMKLMPNYNYYNDLPYEIHAVTPKNEEYNYINEYAVKDKQKNINEIVFLKRIYTKTHQYYEKIEEILNDGYTYEEIVIVYNSKEEVIGIDGTLRGVIKGSKKRSLMETVEVIIQNREDIDKEKFLSKLNEKIEKRSLYYDRITKIDDIHIYLGTLVRRNQDCHCGRHISEDIYQSHGCNISFRDSGNPIRMCSICVLDWLLL